MRLLTINVHAWLEEEQEKKIQILAKAIAEKDYDVIALQEVNQRMDAKKVKGNLREDNYGLILQRAILEAGGRDYQYLWTPSHIGFDIYEEGLALLTKHPIRRHWDFYCTKSKSMDSIQSRKILAMEIEYQGEALEFYSCHMNLPHCPGEKMQEAVEYILQQGKQEGRKILMGDFNTDAIHAKDDYEAILAEGLYDSYVLAEEKDNGVTVFDKISGWDHTKGVKRLDYILMQEKMRVLESKVIFNGINRDLVSDHNGVEVKIAK